MKLSMQLLMEELADWHFEGIPADSPNDMHCAYPAAATVWKYKMDPEAVYIVSAETLPKRSSVEEPPHILCIGAPDDAWLEQPTNLVYCTSDRSPMELMDDVVQVFHRYNTWERSLQEAIDEHLSINELGIRTLAVVNNPIYAHNNNRRVIVSAIPSRGADDAGNERLERYRQEYGYEIGTFLDDETMDTLMFDPDYRYLDTLYEPAIYENSAFGFRNMVCRVSFGGMLLAHLTIDEVTDPLRLRDYCIIKVLADYMVKAILQDADRLSENSGDRIALKDMLDHTLLPESRIRSLLRHSAWKMNDEYVCILFSVGERTETNAVLEALSARLATDLQTSWNIVYKESIVIICNLTQLGIDRPALMKRMAPVARDGLLTASYSMSFYDFKNIYYFYRQALFAEEIGTRHDPTQWSFQADDYLLDFFLSQCSKGMVPEALIPSGLTTLIRHDAEKGTEYVSLLKTFLQENCSIINTVRALYMSRSTVIYQLGRIKEISGLDLDDSRCRMTVYFALCLLDRAAAEN